MEREEKDLFDYLVISHYAEGDVASFSKSGRPSSKPKYFVVSIIYISLFLLIYIYNLAYFIGKFISILKFNFVF